MVCDYEPFTFEYRFVTCIPNIIEDFPTVCTKDLLGEHDLISPAVDSILRSLFFIPQAKATMPETNVKKRACRTKRVARPDDVLSTIESITFSNSKMFGEVKGSPVR
ncbi:hypothetical protein BDC45DRAFT_534923 [Circinella umbellata]|nr:hypothetical protein BDC45DRAFT_534923 [Circinella umbellata]